MLVCLILNIRASYWGLANVFFCVYGVQSLKSHSHIAVMDKKTINDKEVKFSLQCEKTVAISV